MTIWSIVVVYYAFLLMSYIWKKAGLLIWKKAMWIRQNERQQEAKKLIGNYQKNNQKERI